MPTQSTSTREANARAYLTQMRYELVRQDQIFKKDCGNDVPSYLVIKKSSNLAKLGDPYKATIEDVERYVDDLRLKEARRQKRLQKLA